MWEYIINITHTLFGRFALAILVDSHSQFNPHFFSALSSILPQNTIIFSTKPKITKTNQNLNHSNITSKARPPLGNNQNRDAFSPNLPRVGHKNDLVRHSLLRRTDALRVFRASLPLAIQCLMRLFEH